jgi:hypothetical protein
MQAIEVECGEQVEQVGRARAGRRVAARPTDRVRLLLLMSVTFRRSLLLLCGSWTLLVV